MINLGDVRILEEKRPELMEKLLKAVDLDDPNFYSPEFNEAMKDTRRGIFETLEALLSDKGKMNTDTLDAVVEKIKVSPKLITPAEFEDLLVESNFPDLVKDQLLKIITKDDEYILELGNEEIREIFSFFQGIVYEFEQVVAQLGKVGKRGIAKRMFADLRTEYVDDSTGETTDFERNLESGGINRILIQKLDQLIETTVEARRALQKFSKEAIGFGGMGEISKFNLPGLEETEIGPLLAKKDMWMRRVVERATGRSI